MNENEERIRNLEEQIDFGRKIKVMTGSDGWPLLAGYIAGRKTVAMRSLMTAETLEDFVRHQQAYKTMMAIESFVNNTIKMGEVALEQLHPTKKSE